MIIFAMKLIAFGIKYAAMLCTAVLTAISLIAWSMIPWVMTQASLAEQTAIGVAILVLGVVLIMGIRGSLKSLYSGLETAIDT